MKQAATKKGAAQKARPLGYSSVSELLVFKVNLLGHTLQVQLLEGADIKGTPDVPHRQHIIIGLPTVTWISLVLNRNGHRHPIRG